MTIPDVATAAMATVPSATPPADGPPPRPSSPRSTVPSGTTSLSSPAEVGGSEIVTGAEDAGVDDDVEGAVELTPALVDGAVVLADVTVVVVDLDGSGVSALVVAGAVVATTGRAVTEGTVDRDDVVAGAAVVAAATAGVVAGVVLVVVVLVDVVVVVVVVAGGSIGAEQSPGFRGAGSTPGSRGGGSNRGGGICAVDLSRANDQPSIVPGGGVRPAAPRLL